MGKVRANVPQPVPTFHTCCPYFFSWDFFHMNTLLASSKKSCCSWKTLLVLKKPNKTKVLGIAFTLNLPSKSPLPDLVWLTLICTYSQDKAWEDCTSEKHMCTLLGTKGGALWVVDAHYFAFSFEGQLHSVPLIHQFRTNSQDPWHVKYKSAT